ncbi:MAG: PAS domain S-box protein, partial [Armatimonadia bacterium]|nr:PAS domain S-box protein [Armatimonadia bacterium]
DSEQRFQRMLSVVPDMISIHDPDMNILYSNWRGFAAVPEPKRVIGEKCHLVYRDLDRICPDCVARQVLETGSSVHRTVELPEGIWVDLRVIPLIDDTGRVEAFMEWVRDITESVHAEEAERASAERYRALFEQSADGIFVHDLMGEIIDVNPEAVSQHGYTKDELLRLSVFDLLVNPSRREGILRQWQSWPLEQVAIIEDFHRRKDGTLVPVEIKTAKVLFGSQEVMLAVVRDRTDYHQAREALQQSEALQAAMVECSPVALYGVDRADRVLNWNRSAERLFGWRAVEVVGKPSPAVPESDRDQMAAARERVLEGEHFTGWEVSRVRRDGTTFPARLSAAPIRDGAGSVVGVMYAVEDITEGQRLERQLRQSQRMEAVGRLAGGIAHDFNNMLGVILGHAELALGNLDPTEPVAADLEEIQKAAQRSADLTRQLLGFARRQTIQPKIVDLNAAVESMLQMLARLIGEDLDLRWNPGPDLPPIYIDPAQIDQMVTNLVVNARDAIGETVGRITIETASVHFDQQHCATRPGTSPGPHVMLAVSDDGCGMDEQTRAQVFDPFFTTKDAASGTGLGLATVYGIVKQNQGHIGVYSELGEGTTFQIYLPARATETREPAIASTPTAPRGQGEVVLVVEDEPALLAMTADMLLEMGYQSLRAEGAEEALRLAEQHDAPIDLILTDVVMPQMNGRELVDRVTASRSGIKCLFMSGYTENAIAHRNVVEGGVHFLQKPFTMDELAAKVREVLGSAWHGAPG